MKLSEEEYNFLYKKLEYKFKNSGHDLVDKIKDKKDLSNDDIELLLKKLEYTFRKSNHDIIRKLSEEMGLENYSPIKYSIIKAKKLRDIRNMKESNIIDNFDEFLKKIII